MVGGVRRGNRGCFGAQAARKDMIEGKASEALALVGFEEHGLEAQATRQLREGVQSFLPPGVEVAREDHRARVARQVRFEELELRAIGFHPECEVHGVDVGDQQGLPRAAQGVLRDEHGLGDSRQRLRRTQRAAIDGARLRSGEDADGGAVAVPLEGRGDHPIELLATEHAAQCGVQVSFLYEEQVVCALQHRIFLCPERPPFLLNIPVEQRNGSGVETFGFLTWEEFPRRTAGVGARGYGGASDAAHDLLGWDVDATGESEGQQELSEKTKVARIEVGCFVQWWVARL